MAVCPLLLVACAGRPAQIGGSGPRAEEGVVGAGDPRIAMAGDVWVGGSGPVVATVIAAAQGQPAESQNRGDGPGDPGTGSAQAADGARQPQPDPDVARLRDPSLTEAERIAAAEALAVRIARSGNTDPQALVDAVQELLASPDDAAAGFVLRAITRLPEAPGVLLPLLTARLESAEAEARPKILDAIASVRTPQAASEIFAYTDPEQPPEVVGAAFAALARLSGRDDIGRDRARWRTWLDEVRGLSDLDWRRRLTTNFARRADRVTAQRNDALNRLTDALRRLHLATPAEQRPELLASMLLDDLPQVRDLGFELISRELSATGRIDGPVGDAALKLLTHANAAVRGSAAVLVRRIVPQGAEAAVTRALEVEQDPSAAESLLLAATRWPSAALVGPTLQWLESGTPAADDAAESAVVLLRSGLLDAAGRERVLAAVRGHVAESETPATTTLRIELGDEADRADVRPMLESPSAAVRSAAAEALLWYPEFLPEILEAADRHPELFDAATRAVLVDGPTAELYSRLRGLTAPTPEIARRGLLRLANALPPMELAAVIAQETDTSMRRALLESMTREERVLSEAADARARSAIAAAAARLAQLHLEQRKPEDALELLERIPFLGSTESAGAAREIRCVSLVVLGRFDLADDPTGAGSSAAAAPCGKEPWLRALAMSRQLPVHRQIAAGVLERFGESLTEEERKPIEQLLKDAEPAENGAAAAGTGGG